MFQVILLNALFACTFTLGKMVLTYTAPLFFVGLSMTISGFLMLLYLLIDAPYKLKIAKKDLPHFIQISFFTIFVSYGLQFWGMQYMPSYKACFLYNSEPFTSYLVAYFVFNEKMILKKWMGLLIGFIGLLPIVLSAVSSDELTFAFSRISLPELAIIFAAFIYAYGWFTVRSLVYDHGYSASAVNGWTMFLGGIMMLSAVPFLEGPIYVKEFVPFTILLWATIIIEYWICNSLYMRLLKHYSETFLAFATFLIPLFGALYGRILLQEKITWHFFISCLIVLTAIGLFYHAEVQLNPNHHVRD